MDATSFAVSPNPGPGSANIQSFVLFANFFFPALAFVVVTTRTAGKLSSRQFGLDDWLICIAMLMSIAETTISYFFIKTNFIGVPLNQVPPRDPTEGLIWGYAVQILYNPVLALVKSSVLIFLARLFEQKGGVRRVLVWLNVINIAQMIGVFFAITLQCMPIAFNWDPTIRGGRCVERRALYVSTSAFNILTDMILIGIPLWIFSGLKIPRRTKIAIMFVFLLGFLVTITSIIRLLFLLHGLYGLTIFQGTMTGVGFITSGIEINLALVTASAPALRLIFRSRERGGLFRRTLVASSRVADEEKGTAGSKSVGWETPKAGATFMSRLGRRGSRGGRRGSARSARGTRPGRGGKAKPIIRVRTEAVELRSQSPRASEEEAMTNNGIMRVSDIQREIDGIAREIAATGSGAYMPRPSTAGTMSGRVPSFALYPSLSNPPARPSTSGDGASGARRYPERYYSESVYPDADYKELDFNDDRVSRYGDRRFGVVTPKGTTPTATSWRQAGGRPF